jgi:glycosyltransferase involved in cell wall biosynthesis
MPLISLAMIVKNEETNLAHCLESVRQLVDEMIIIDTGSTDGTIDIARGFGAKVHHFLWCDDFSAARNESLKHCKGEWALILDGDEAIDPLDYEKIRAACARPTADCYALIHRHYLQSSSFSVEGRECVPNVSKYGEGKALPFYVDTSVYRLARMFDGLSFIGRIHETLDQSVLSSGKTLGDLDAVIHHYGHLDKGRVDYKAQYYFMLSQKEAEQSPLDDFAQYKLLKQAITAKQWDVALKGIQERMQINPEAQEPSVMYWRGIALHGLGRHEEAIKAMDLLLALKPSHHIAIAHKADSYVALGDIDGGRQLMLKAMELAPSYVPGYRFLAELEINHNNLDAARKILLDAFKVVPNEETLYGLMLNVELLSENHSQAGEVALQGLRKFPNGGDGKWAGYVALYYSQAAELEFRAGNYDAARKIALDVIEVVPGEAVFYDILLKIELAKNNYQQAARYAQQGIENCPNGGNGIWHRLASVYLVQIGESAAAKSMLELGLKAFPDDSELSRLKGLLR